MQTYYAPLEGITTFTLRNTHAKYFGGIDKYFTPFISPTSTNKLTTKEMNDVRPEHNEGMNVVPQILANNPEQFIFTMQKLEKLGYNEINLNVGCPSGTVCSKGKGAGFLGFPDKLDAFLDDIYNEAAKDKVKISIKTRLGVTDYKEFETILDIFNKYPVSELIVHPRLRTDFYKNTPNLDVYHYAEEYSKHDLCYNGDIFTYKLYDEFREKFPNCTKVMLGRGVIMNPNLSLYVKGEPLKGIDVFKAYHDEVYQLYKDRMPGEKPTLFKMKELWWYMIHSFNDSEKYGKRIKKCNKLSEYESVTNELFANLELRWI